MDVCCQEVIIQETLKTINGTIRRVQCWKRPMPIHTIKEFSSSMDSKAKVQRYADIKM